MQEARASEAGAVVRFTLLAAAVGVGFLVLGALWMSTCTGGAGRDTAACGPVQYTLLGLGAPLVLLITAAWAFWRGYARRGAAWHGTGIILLLLTAVTLIPAN
jgi:hypothetical protein